MTAPGRVLLVEDDPAIRGLLSLTIEGEGYHVQSAGDGLEALDKVRHERPDVIILDLVMPSMDGWTLIDALAGDARTRDIPIIAVSAAHRYTRVGERSVKAFLSKPFDVDTLVTVLEDVSA